MPAKITVFVRIERTVTLRSNNSIFEKRKVPFHGQGSLTFNTDKKREFVRVSNRRKSKVIGNFMDILGQKTIKTKTIEIINNRE